MKRPQKRKPQNEDPGYKDLKMMTQTAKTQKLRPPYFLYYSGKT